MNRQDMKVGGRYNWKYQSERLVYVGRNWSGNGYWHQFEKVDEPGKVWCEVLDSDLHMIEQTLEWDDRLGRAIAAGVDSVDGGKTNGE